MNEKTTDFGYERVRTEEKASRVRAVFDSVARQYDIMNDLMSAGMHRLWKRHAVAMARIRPGQQVLDVAGGTGDLAALIYKQLRGNGQVVLSDINAQMLKHGQERLLNDGMLEGVFVLQADAQSLPFEDNSFDHVTIGFGLRNVTDKAKALSEFYRVLKPAGRLMVLEFSKPAIPALEKFYDMYSFSIIPKIGRWVTGDEKSYQYLVESIRKHPDQSTLKKMILDAGFFHADYENLTGGIVAIHRGVKA